MMFAWNKSSTSIFALEEAGADYIDVARRPGTVAIALQWEFGTGVAA
jgi:hypothetical protein